MHLLLLRTMEGLRSSMSYSLILPLYLSRVDRTEGCILKTVLSNENDGDNDSSNKSYLDKNTLLNIEYSNDISFIDYLNGIKDVHDSAFEHTKVGIENYLDEEISYYSIYDFRNFEDVSIFNGEGSALTLNVYGDYLDLVYHKDSFSDIYIEHMADNLVSMIDDLIGSPNQALTDVSILSKNEVELLLDYCKGMDADVDEEFIISKAFRSNAIDNPDAIAVDDGVNQISYGELEKSSNSIANDLLCNHDISLGSHVALLLPRNYHFPELVLALNKIGAAFIPVDLVYPKKRIDHMLDISQSECIVTTKDIAGMFDFNIKVICLEDLNRDDDVEVDIMSKGENLLSIMFTSGTTGLPKGVMVSNKQFAGLYVSFRNIFDLSYGDRVGNYLSFSFIASYVIYATLSLGGCCRIFNENEQKDILSLITELKENPMNSLILPPTVGIPILENEDLKLDYLVFAGAKLNELTRRERNTQLINFYGTTEIVFGVTKVYNINDIKCNRVPIGRPVTNTHVYILDKNLNQMPIGVSGEICVSSDYISSGYYNNPELTEEVFVDNPFIESKKMYRTGDIGFYNFEGEIEILGREDDQLSVRGFRIESGEILTIINSFEEIEDVYLDVDHDTLILYYTTNGNLDIDLVKDALVVDLPRYMVPSLFIELDEIPLNLNGKIDKAALKRMFKGKSDIDINDDILATVIDAFKEVLGTDVVLMDDEFIELGGNSLSAMQLQILLRDKLGANLSANEMMELSTPVAIADHIKFNLDNRAPIDVKYGFEDEVPLSNAQLNVYLDEAVNDMGTGYNNAFKIEFDNDRYSVDAVKEALLKLVDVYPILKARIANGADGPVCVFDADLEISEGSLEDINSFVRPFEVDRNLSRFLIVNVDERNILCCDFHHLIFDGTSFGILFERLYSILNGVESDFVDNGMLMQISFEEGLSQEYREEARAFFDKMLADKDEVYDLLPSVKCDESVDADDEEFSYKDNPKTTYRETFEIDNDSLNSFLQRNHVTPNQFFTSVFAYALSRFTGSSKVLFNLIEDGRGHMDLSQSVGMFVKTLPILMDCKNQDIGKYLKYSSDLINTSMKYDLYPFHVLANEYDLNSSVFFQYSHDIFANALNQGEFGFVVDELDHDLNGELSCFIFNLDENNLAIGMEYSDKYSKSFIEQFTKSYRLILQEMLNSNRLDEIKFIDSKDIELLDSYNETYHPLVCNDILDAFNENLAKNPDNALVAYEDNSYTYGEGAFLADRIAKKLADLGVGHQDYVSFLVNRSEYYMFCVLGILSIGGVYVPLDDAHPDDRIEYILNDTESKVLIVSDDTYERGKGLETESIILNVSDILKEEIGTLVDMPVSYGDLACILYTSGTTGIPKGVKITRKSVLNLSEFYCRKYDLTDEDVYGLFASIGFDVAMKAIFPSIYSGACLNVIPNELKLDMQRMNDYFIRHGITHTEITTQVAKLFIDQVDKTSLKVLTTGGEKLGESEIITDYRFVDSYGPTEACVDVTSIDAIKRIDPSSIGFLLDNIKAYILDDEFRRVPLGAVGELFLAGNQIAAGYLNRDEETKKAFLDNPFEDNEDYGVIYRTGDMVRMLPDGSLGIVGRRDSQVKIRGNRVELSEIEAVIRELDFVDDLTVQTVKNGTNNELVAYVVTSREMADEELKDSVCSYVAEYKPPYMVPSFVIGLDEIPLNVNGKIDKRALPDVERAVSDVKYVAPRDEREKEIVEAFEKVFDKEKISIYDDFIRLGGDSLTAIKLLSYIESDVTMADIFSFRTPEEIAKNISDFSFDLDLYSLESGCPLNGAQINVFADIMIYNKLDAYHVPSYMVIPKKYSIEDILDALDKLLEAHPVLSMCLSTEYEAGDENISNFDLIKDLLNLGKKFGLRDIVSLINGFGLTDVDGLYNMARTVLRLLKGEYPYIVKGIKPPIRVESHLSKDLVVDFFLENLDLYSNLAKFMIAEGEESYYLFSMIHHIIFDASSAGVFKQDMKILLDGGSIDLDDTFLKAAAFAHQIKNTDKFLEASDFYDSILDDVDNVAPLMEDSVSKGYSMYEYNLDFDKEAFKSFLKKAGISENVFFTSIFSYALSQFVDGDKVLFTMIENGRDRFDENSIGMTSNVMPLVIDCKDQSINSFMDYMADSVYGVVRHSYYPILLLFLKYNFEVKILFQYVPNWIVDEIKDIEDISASQITNEVLEAYGDFLTELLFQVFQEGDDYSLVIINSNRYSEKMINDLKDTFLSVLSNIIHSDMSSNLRDTLNGGSE